MDLIKISKISKKYPIPAFIVVFQLAFVLILSLKACIEPRTKVSFGMDAFNVDWKNAYIEDGAVKFVNDGSIDNKNRLNISLESTNVHIPSGGYNVSVVYDSMVGGDRVNESNATLSISSPWTIVSDPITLNDQDNEVSGRLWIPFFTDCDNLKLTISYNGIGTLSVSKITFTEAVRYRLMRIIGFAGLFVIADILILIFFSDYKVRLKKRTMALILIILVSSIPFLSKILFSGHDLWFHMLRITSISEELKNGQFPVRMSTELNNGYGYPTSIYYCDIFLYPAAILYGMFVPLKVCYQIYVILVNAFTTIFTYISLRKVTDKEHLCLLGTGLYVLCMYRLANINVRAAVGEYTAMAFLPLIIAGVYSIYAREKPTCKDWLYLSFGMAGVITSHLLTGEMIAANLILLCLIMIRKTIKKEVMLSFVKAALVCLGITAWFLIPFLDYFTGQVNFVQKEDLRLLETSTQDLIFLFQLFSPGKDVEHYATLGMPLVAGIVLVLYYLAQYKDSQRTRQEKALLLTSGFAFMNIIFVSKYFPWSRIQKYLGINGLGYQVGTIQFAWRFLGIASIALTFAIVWVLTLLEEKKNRNVFSVEMCLLACIVLSTGFFYYKFTDEASTCSYNSCDPYAASDSLYLLAGTDRSVQNRAAPVVLSGQVALSESGKSKGVYTVHVENSPRRAVISVPIYGYRYYKAYDEGESLLETRLTDSNCVAISIPDNYSGDVTVKFVPPYSWRVAEIISLLCILSIIAWSACNYMKKKHIKDIRRWKSAVL